MGGRKGATGEWAAGAGQQHRIACCGVGRPLPLGMQQLLNSECYNKGVCATGAAWPSSFLGNECPGLPRVTPPCCSAVAVGLPEQCVCVYSASVRCVLVLL